MFKRSLFSKFWMAVCLFVVLTGVVLVFKVVSVYAAVWLAITAAFAYSLGSEFERHPRPIDLETLLWVAELEEKLAKESVNLAQVARDNNDAQKCSEYTAIAAKQFEFARAMRIAIDANTPDYAGQDQRKTA